MGKRFAESRSHRRKAVTWEVLAGETSANIMRTRGWTDEVSACGCRILADELIEEGEDIRVLMVAERRILHLKGKVVRSLCLGDGEFELGIAFGGVSERNFLILSQNIGKMA